MAFFMGKKCTFMGKYTSKFVFFWEGNSKNRFKKWYLIGISCKYHVVFLI